MAIREHIVSNRNGVQIMVAGLKLRELGYGPGASVDVSDPTGTPGHERWRFVVANNEHATLVSRQPPPPEWIQPGVRVRIEVRPASGAATAPAHEQARGEPIVSASMLGDWRRALIRLLDSVDEPRPSSGREGIAARIGRLQRDGRIPREVAAFMKTVTEVRNQTEYSDKRLTAVESAAVSAAWAAVQEWASTRRR